MQGPFFIKAHNFVNTTTALICFNVLIEPNLLKIANV